MCKIGRKRHTADTTTNKLGNNLGTYEPLH